LTTSVAPGLSQYRSLTFTEASGGTTLSPKDITLAPGTTITWTSADNGRHRVRTLDGAPIELDSGGALEGPSAWSFTFTKAGTYPYVDDEGKDNAALRGTVTVGTVPSNPGAGGGAGAPPAPTTASVSLAGHAFNPASVTVRRRSPPPAGVASRQQWPVISRTPCPASTSDYRPTTPRISTPGWASNGSRSS
jgi:plastocyanin